LTNSRSGEQRGRQQPRVLLRPPWDSETDAEDAIDLIASCGQELDEWQRLLVRMTLATKGGRLAASEVGALVARQNGKGGWLEAVAIWALFVAGGTTMWTAHELKTSDEAHQRIVMLLRSNPDLEAEVVKWDGGLTGQHILQLRNGARLVFVARSKSSGRGLSPQRIIFDEAQEFSTLAFRAMMYATSAQGTKRQLIYAGTVPGPENNSEIWTGARDRGRKGEVKRLAWAEWTPEGSDSPSTQIDPTSLKVRAWANPALGTRILAETIDEEWDAAQADLEGFLRERLSVWPSLEAGSGVIDWAAWKACKAPTGPVTGPIVLAVETSLDRSQSVIVAVATFGELPRVKVLQSAAGTGWVAASVAKIATDHPEIRAVVVDSRAQASALIEPISEALDLAHAQVDVVVTSTADMVQACGVTLETIRDQRIVHGGEPSLDAAVRGATQRDVGDNAWAWSRRKGGPAAAPLVAMSLALWKWLDLTSTDYDISDSFG
jgi:hypothetical protein